MRKPEERTETADRRRFCFGWQIAALLAALLVVGAVVGFFVAKSTGHRIVRGVTIAGTPVGRLNVKEAEDLLRIRAEVWSKTAVTLTCGDKSWAVTPATFGLIPDYAATLAEALRVGRRGGPLARWRERKSVARTGLALPLAFRVDRDRWNASCQAIEAEVNQEPESVHFAVNPAGKLTSTPGRDGLKLDRSRLLADLQKGFADRKKREYILPVLVVKAPLSREEVVSWPLDQVLAFYSTKFNAADQSRTHNLSMAAAALDGLIIKPGDEFSFNEHVGPRVPEKGYMEAPVVLKNQLVLGMGGGVCQVSSTLFNAALYASLPVGKRTNHSLPSTYVPLGRDATVVYDVVDLSFSNDTGRPVLIAAGIYGSRLTVALIGHRDAKPVVRLEVETKETIPHETVVENDPGLAAGVEAVTQAGRDGYKVQLWRTSTWPDGRSVREQIGKVAYYPPIKKVVKRGIGSPRFGNWTPPQPVSQHIAPAATPGVVNP
ncbi:MAG: VanW family protein [Bacteroidota bacterium]